MWLTELWAQAAVKIPGLPDLSGLNAEAIKAAWWDGASRGALAGGLVVLAIVVGLGRRDAK